MYTIIRIVSIVMYIMYIWDHNSGKLVFPSDISLNWINLMTQTSTVDSNQTRCSIRIFIIVQLLFSFGVKRHVAAVKIPPILHHTAVFYFHFSWDQWAGIFENQVLLKLMLGAMCSPATCITGICLFVLRFYGPVYPMGSCRARSAYLTTRLLGRFSPLSG